MYLTTDPHPEQIKSYLKFMIKRQIITPNFFFKDKTSGQALYKKKFYKWTMNT